MCVCVCVCVCARVRVCVCARVRACILRATANDGLHLGSGTPAGFSAARWAGSGPQTPRRPTWCRRRRTPAAALNERAPAPHTEYRDSQLARFLQGFFEAKLLGAVAAHGHSDGTPAAADRPGARSEDADASGFDRMIVSALQVSQLPGAQARAVTLQLLHALFPAWLVQGVRGLFALFPTWFVARHASVLSVLLTYWLVGKSEVQDVDAALLDADARAGWGNTPTGWVPGFALGGKWRPAVGASQGVLVERCRVLEASGCASVCANVCKAPTQDFFTHGVGLPLTMVPDYETQSCTLIFGASPPPLADDEAFTHGCLASCALVLGDAAPGRNATALREAEVERRLEAWRRASPARASSCPL